MNRSLAPVVPIFVPLLTVVQSCSGYGSEFDADNGDSAMAAGSGSLVINGDNGYPASAFPLGLCQGDCDKDIDCASGLKCYERTGTQPVPGCGGGGVSGKDYCYQPEGSGTLIISGDNGSPATAFPLGRCQGDCDNDADCASGLKCYERSATQLVPGCSGVGVSGKDYCYEKPRGGGANLSFPVRGTFYYPWYPQTWTVSGKCVHDDPLLGSPNTSSGCNKESGYHSDNDGVIKQHIEWMDGAKIDLAIASWWGRNKLSEGTIIPKLLNAADGHNLKWAFYYEHEGFYNPDVARLRSDLGYLLQSYASHRNYALVDGRPVLFVYNANDSGCAFINRWKEAAGDDWYLVLKVFGGYRDCGVKLNGKNFPDSWHQYGTGGATGYDRQAPHSSMVCPGFWKADSGVRLPRDISRFERQVKKMVADGDNFQLIITFNEWGEGTAVEPAKQWGNDYLRIMRENF